MAQTSVDSGTTDQDSSQKTLTFHADGQDRIELPSHEYISDAKMTRDGDDLVLQAPDGSVAVIDGYFSADPAPLLISADGAVLTPNLVESFARSPLEFAANNTANDESPVGAVEEVKGTATVTRADGTIETIVAGTPIYQGDIVQTDGAGAVNIVFMDETSMAISQNARMAIDQYTYDPATESGTTNFSVLRGLFVFTSGLIGRDDPDDVRIDTPVGSIGIRGTIIAGEINPGGESNVSVLEGAIVVTNGLMDTTLSRQFETVRLGNFNESMHSLGVVPAADINTKFTSIGNVLPSLFSVINDAVHEQAPQPQSAPPAAPQAPQSNAEPVQQTPAPLQDIVSLNNSNGLPSNQTALGQNTAGVDAHAPVNTAASTAGTTTPLSTMDRSAPSTTGDTPLPPNLTTRSDTGATSSTTSPPPAAPTVSYTANNLLDTAHAGDFVGTITRQAGVTYGISANANFNLVTIDANTMGIQVSSAGASALGSSLDVVQLGLVTITALGSDGQATTQTVTPIVTDANSLFNLGNSLTAGVSVISDNINNDFGYSITGVGDINHDGFDDLLASNNSPTAGQNHLYKFYGSSAILADDFILTAGGTTIINPTSASTSLETVVSNIGDFNGDGISDYIIGQSGDTWSGLATGNIHIINGQNPSNNMGFTGGAAGDQIGASASGIGDFNNDGFADAIFGAPGALSGGGRTYMVNGSTTSWTGFTPTILSGTGVANYGAAVKGIGDFNGDGYSDYAVGAPGGNGYVDIVFGHKNSGGAPVTFHVVGNAGEGLGTEIVALGDINGDGYSDVLVAGSGNTGLFILGNNQNITTYNLGGTDYDVTGGGAVGDFNGDGFDDYAISMANSTDTKIYVVFGKEGTLAPTIDFSYLKNPDNAMELTYNGVSKTDNKLEISGVGDLNGDGRDDFAIGVPDANGASAGNGGMIVVYGRDTGGHPVNMAASANNQALIGTANNDTMSDNLFLYSSIHGGAGNDIIKIANNTFRNIDGGGNTGAVGDTLVFDNGAAGGTLDFSNINYEQISGIENINFGQNFQTIKLTMENIFNLLKSSDGFDNGTDHYSGYLKISANGTGGSHLILDAGGLTGTHNAALLSQIDAALELASTTGGVTPTDVGTAPGTYDTFRIGGYMLLIDNAITVDVQ